MAKQPRILVDSSVIVSALNSFSGAPALVMEMGRGEARVADLLITPYIVAEVDDVVKRKFPKNSARWIQLKKDEVLTKVDNPSFAQLKKYTHLIDDPADVPIVAAGFMHDVDFLVTLDRKHFLDNKKLVSASEFEIIHPSDLVAEFLLRESK